MKAQPSCTLDQLSLLLLLYGSSTSPDQSYFPHSVTDVVPENSPLQMTCIWISVSESTTRGTQLIIIQNRIGAGKTDVMGDFRLRSLPDGW